MNWTQLGSSFAAAFAVSWVATACLIRIAPQMGLIDLPSDRKVHSRPTPKGGGLAIWLAINVACLAVLPCFESSVLASIAPLTPVLWVLLAIVLLGLADDRIGLPWYARFVVQTTIAACLLWYFRSSLADHRLLFVLAVLWLVGMSNSFNMLDNMDGLSGGVAWIAAAFLLIVESVPPRSAPELDTIPAAPAMLLISLMGGLTGFLWFNRPPARIFMGDCGSTAIGFLLGLMGLRLALRPHGPEWAWAAVLCVFAVPIYDMTTVVLLRLYQGRSPFHADKQHLSHRLVERGLSTTGAVLVIHAYALASGFLGYLVYNTKEMVGALGCIAMMAVVIMFPAIFELLAWRNRKAKEGGRNNSPK